MDATSELIVTDCRVNDSLLRIAAVYRNQQLCDMMAETAPAGFTADAEQNVSALSSGTIICGVVERISESLKSGMVRIGGGETLFLPFTEDTFFSGTKLAVQITKEAAGKKQPACTNRLTLDGHYVIVREGARKLTFSTRLSLEERERLTAETLSVCRKRILFRTASGSAEVEDVLLEIKTLQDILDRISSEIRNAPVGRVLWRRRPFYLRMKEEHPEISRIQTDIPAIAEKFHVPCYQDRALTLASLKGLSADLERLLQKKVHLKSGGFLVIERTEAFHVIDVNTGSYTSSRTKEDLIRTLNLEAAEEIARQIRLRNLSGIILVDFVSMKEKESRSELMKAMQACLSRDRCHAKVEDLTKLDIMEITRERREKSYAELFL